MVPDTLFWPRGNIFVLKKNEQSMKCDKTDDNLGRNCFFLNCRWVIWIVTCHVNWYRCWCTSPWRWLEEIMHSPLVRQLPLLLQNLLIARKHPHISMFMVPCIVNLYYNKPTRCSCAQSILFHCRVTLHVSGAFHTHHQEYIKLCL